MSETMLEEIKNDIFGNDMPLRFKGPLSMSIIDDIILVIGIIKDSMEYISFVNNIYYYVTSNEGFSKFLVQ